MRGSHNFLKHCQFIVLVLSLFFISACSLKEIEKSAFIAGIGIDLSDNQEKPYKVTLKIYNLVGTIRDNPQPNYTYVSEEGKTITDAIRLLETRIDKRFEFGHLKIIILGEESVKKQNIKNTLDFLMRRADIQLISWVMVARPSAEKIIKHVPSTETAAYPALYNYFDHNANESPLIVTEYLFEFSRRYQEQGIEPTIPIIEIEKEQFKIDKSLVVGENGKSLELTSEETKIFNILKGNVAKADLIVDREDKLFTIEVDRFKVDYQVVENPGAPLTLKIEMDVKGIITESKTDIKIEKLHEYNRLAEAAATENVDKFLTKLIGGGFDPVGFGLRYKTKHLHNNQMNYDEWKKEYQNANIDVKINIELKATGQIG